MAGKDGNPNLSAYSASKAAVIGLTKSLGKELATTGVLVNAIAPAVIATEMNAATAPDVLAHITSLIPMKRVGQPEEVAELVAWLVSDRLQLLHRRGLRHQRRPRDVLAARSSPVIHHPPQTGQRARATAASFHGHARCADRPGCVGISPRAASSDAHQHRIAHPCRLCLVGLEPRPDALTG